MDNKKYKIIVGTGCGLLSATMLGGGIAAAVIITQNSKKENEENGDINNPNKPNKPINPENPNGSGNGGNNGGNGTTPENPNKPIEPENPEHNKTPKFDVNKNENLSAINDEGNVFVLFGENLNKIDKTKFVVKNNGTKISSEIISINETQIQVKINEKIEKTTLLGCLYNNEKVGNLEYVVKEQTPPTITEPEFDINNNQNLISINNNEYIYELKGKELNLVDESKFVVKNNEKKILSEIISISETQIQVKINENFITSSLLECFYNDEKIGSLKIIIKSNEKPEFDSSNNHYVLSVPNKNENFIIKGKKVNNISIFNDVITVKDYYNKNVNFKIIEIQKDYFEIQIEKMEKNNILSVYFNDNYIGNAHYIISETYNEELLEIKKINYKFKNNVYRETREILSNSSIAVMEKYWKLFSFTQTYNAQQNINEVLIKTLNKDWNDTHMFLPSTYFFNLLVENYMGWDDMQQNGFSLIPQIETMELGDKENEPKTSNYTIQVKVKQENLTFQWINVDEYFWEQNLCPRDPKIPLEQKNKIVDGIRIVEHKKQINGKYKCIEIPLVVYTTTKFYNNN